MLEVSCKGFPVHNSCLAQFRRTRCLLLTLTLGWEGRVPLAFILLTSLLNAVISPSFLICLEPATFNASSICSAMNGVAIFPSWSTFKPFSPASTSSTESTTPECAEKYRRNSGKPRFSVYKWANNSLCRCWIRVVWKQEQPKTYLPILIPVSNHSWPPSTLIF